MTSEDRSLKEDKMKPIRRAIIFVLTMFLVIVLLLEMLLYWLDPLGLVAYMHSFERMYQTTIPDETGYTFIEGTHDMMNYSYTILDNHSRRIPATNLDATCVIAGIGDSVTFGMGVEDEQTWLNLVAEQFPNVQFVNWGRPVFGAENVYSSYQNYDADGYLWLVISNDDFGEAGYKERQPNYVSALRLYWLYVLYPAIFGKPAYNVIHEYTNDVDEDVISVSAQLAEQMLAHDNILIFGFDEYPTNRIEAAITISYYDDTVGLFDHHPSFKGNQQIAASILPHVTDFVERICSNNNATN